MKATIAMTKDAQPRGEYKETSLDAQRKQADILIQAIDDKYSIHCQNTNIALSGRGVTSYGNGNYAVTETVLNKLKKQYKVECDF